MVLAYLKSIDLCAAIHFMDLKKIDLNLLVALEALLAERNVTKAGQRLRLSQPALSARLNRLREIFSDRLLIPAQRGMTPTQRALELEAPLHEALENVRRVVGERQSFDPSKAKLTFATAASDYIQYALLTPLMLSLRNEAPGLRYVWRTLDIADLARQMETGEVDAAILTHELTPEHLRVRKLFDERYLAIVRKNHPKVKRKLDLDTFCALDHAVVSPRGGGFSGETDVALAAHKRKRRVVLSVPNFLMLPEVIARSDMIALAPERIVRDRAARLQLLEPPIPVPGFTLSLAWHDRTHATPAQKWFRERLAAATRTSSGD